MNAPQNIVLTENIKHTKFAISATSIVVRQVSVYRYWHNAIITNS